MSNLDEFVSKLKGVKPSGNGWSARCPAHDDHCASLSISEGDGGRVLVKCHAGCAVKAVVSALGLTLRDLMPASTATAQASPPRPKPGERVFPTADAAAAELEARHGKSSRVWAYRDAAGQMVGLVARWDTEDGKDIRPAARFPDGWRVKAMPAPRPLYRLPELVGASRVIVTEGEKCADAAVSLGFTATTSVSGAQSPHFTDWMPLAGKEVWILPDNDVSGRKYAEVVTGILSKLTPAPVVRTLALPGLPVKGDIVDWIDAHGDIADADSMRAEIEAMARASKLPARSSAPTGSTVTPKLICLDDVEPAEVQWLWPGRIPLGRITLLVGRPGAGKSFVTCDMAGRISTGAEWPCGGLAPIGDTLFICAEDDPADTIVPRLVASGTNRKRVHLLRAATVTHTDGTESEVAFDLSNVNLIRQALDKLPKCKLVVIDPIGSYLGGDVDAHRDNEVRAVLAPLASLASEKGVAILLVGHNRKAGAAFADDTALGSRAFVGLARSVLHLSDDPDDTARERKLLLPGKMNLSDSAPGLAFRIVGRPPRLEWEPEPLDLHADDVQPQVGENHRGPKPKKKEAAVSWLAAFLRGGARPVNEIREAATAAGLSWATIRRAQEELDITPTKRQFSGGWVWELLVEDAHPVLRTCSKGEQREHLRGAHGETAPVPQENHEGAHAASHLSTFAPPPASVTPPGDTEPQPNRRRIKNNPYRGTLFDTEGLS